MKFPERIRVPVTDGGDPVVLAMDDMSDILMEIRNRGFDELVLGDDFLPDTLRLAARLLVMSAAVSGGGIVMDAAEADAQVERCDPVALTESVAIALYGGGLNKTYDNWVYFSLRANGLDPRDLNPIERHGILEILRQTGRAPDPAKWIDSVDAIRSWNNRRGQVETY